MIPHDPELRRLGRAQFAHAYATAGDILRSDKSRKRQFIEIVGGRNRDGLDAFGEYVREMVPVGCKSGCSSCCHQEVPISASDACWIALWLRTRKHPIPDLAKAAAAVADLSKEQRYANGIACPFLRDRSCSIYEVRPEPCRSHFSTSRPACLQSWAQRKKPATPQIPFLAEPKIIGPMIVAGSDCAMGEHGLQPAMGELAAMIGVACRPNAVEAWLNGEAIFPPSKWTAIYTDGLRRLHAATVAAQA